MSTSTSGRPPDPRLAPSEGASHSPDRCRRSPRAIPRVALVTGAAQRIGRTIALALAQAGFDIAIHCHTSRDAAASTCDSIRGLGRRAAVLQADLADEAATQALMPRAAAALGPIGVLVNNASPFERDEWHDATRASWDAHIEPGLRAPFVLMQHFARALPADAEGVVINMLDQRVWSITPHFVSYTVAKAGPLGADAVDGAGAGAAHQGERHRPGSGAGQPAADAGSSSRASPPRCRCVMAPAPTRSPARCWPSLPCRR